MHLPRGSLTLSSCAPIPGQRARTAREVRIVPTITGLFGVVAEDALVLGVPGLAIAALAGVAVVGGTRARPLAKGAIKGYFSLKDQTNTLKDRASEWVAGTREELEDLYAEAKHDYTVHATGGTAESATAASAAPTASASTAEPKAPVEPPEVVQARTITEAVQKAADADAPAGGRTEQPAAERPGRARAGRAAHNPPATVQARANAPLA
jgi:hypothetical protein